MLWILLGALMGRLLAEYLLNRPCGCSECKGPPPEPVRALKQFYTRKLLG